MVFTWWIVAFFAQCLFEVYKLFCVLADELFEALFPCAISLFVPANMQ